MRITQAAPRDAARISRIYAASWKAGYAGLIDPSYLENLDPDHWTAAFEAWLAGEDIRAKLAWAGDTPAGAVAYGRFAPPAGAEGGACPGGYIQSLYVHPAYMGGGYGTALLRAAEAALEEAGYTGCFLYVLDTNRRARAFYARNGYAWDGASLACAVGGQPLTDLRYVKAFPALGGLKDPPA